MRATATDSLRVYLEGRSVTRFARLVGVSRTAVYGWLAGVIPEPERWASIEEHTYDAVPVAAWLEQVGGPNEQA